MSFLTCVLLLPTLILLTQQEQKATQQSKEKSEVFVDCLAFSNKGTYLAAGGKGEIFLWKQNDSRKKQTLRINGTSINSLAFGFDFKLAAARHDGRIYVFDLTRMKLLFKLEGDGKSLNSCVFSSKGDILIAAGAGAKVMFWSLATQQITRKISFDKPITRISLSESENCLALTLWRQPETAFELMQSRGEVVLYDLKKDTTKQVLTPHKSKVTFVEQLAGNKLVTAGYDGRVLLHDLNRGKIEREWKHGSWVTSVAIAQRTGKVASGDIDGMVKIWDFKTGKLLELYENKEYIVNDLAFSPDESLIAFSFCNLALSKGDLRLVRFVSLD